jgi:hypothetical protein
VIREFSSGLILPALALGVLGWLVPRLLARVWPEGVWPLLLLAFASTLVLIVLATALFLLLYVGQGVPLAAILDVGVLGGWPHFLRLGLASALVWAPIMVLSVAGVPRHWKGKTW